MSDQIEIFILAAETSPVRLSVSGEAGNASATIPVGKNTRIDMRLLPVLETCTSITWRRVGEALETPPPAVDPGFDADAIIEGTVADVEARLATLTPEELLSVRAAEEDREVPRKGVRAAIDKAIAATNVEETPHADQD